jgi:hypothetical protein
VTDPETAQAGGPASSPAVFVASLGGLGIAIHQTCRSGESGKKGFGRLFVVLRRSRIAQAAFF